MSKDLELSVTLRTDLPGHKFLVVNNGDHLHTFEKNENAHVITWTLTGNASHCEFYPPDGHSPGSGFQWPFNKPREGIFSAVSRPAPNKLRMVNHHIDRTTEGTWPYQLFARFGDEVYQMLWVTANGPANSPNPTIKNT